MDVFGGLELIFNLIERPQLTETEKSLISEIGYAWSGTSIDCEILNITIKVIKLIEGSNSVIFNYITKLNALLTAKGCGVSSIYSCVIPPIFGDSV